MASSSFFCQLEKDFEANVLNKYFRPLFSICKKTEFLSFVLNVSFVFVIICLITLPPLFFGFFFGFIYYMCPHQQIARSDVLMQSNRLNWVSTQFALSVNIHAGVCCLLFHLCFLFVWLILMFSPFERFSFLFHFPLFLFWKLYVLPPFFMFILYNVLCWVAQSCPALCDPVGCSPPGSSVHGGSPGRNTGVGCYALLWGIFQPRDQTQISYTEADSLPSEPQGKPKSTETGSQLFSMGSSLAQESNLSLLHCRWILYQLSYQGSPPYVICTPNLVTCWYFCLLLKMEGGNLVHFKHYPSI